MADSFVRVPPDSTGKKVDAASLDVGADVVYRQRIVLADNASTAEYATVAGGALSVAFSADSLVRLNTGTALIGSLHYISATVNTALSTLPPVAISGTAQVAISTPFTIDNISATVMTRTTGIINLGPGTDNIGTLNDISRTVQVAVSTPFTVNNISATVTVAGSVGIAAGTANIGSINNISRTVQVAIGTPFTLNNISATTTVVGVVGLTAGAANIGFINHVSATVQVAIGTPFTVNNISATAVVSGVVGLTAGTANIGFINHISATVVVAGVVGLAAGTANIGHLDSISRTVQVAIGTPFTVNNISATVQVAFSADSLVRLNTGTANIGRINDISATVTAAISTFSPIVRQQVQARASLTAAGLATLAAATYLVSDTYTCNTNKPTDVIVELGVGTTNTPAGLKQVTLFIQESLDGTNFRSGPTSGTTTTDEPDLRYLGAVPLNTSSTGITHIGMFSVANACGFVPYAFRVVFKNEVGVALTTALAATSEIRTILT